jgi:hypothetical protein
MLLLNNWLIFSMSSHLSEMLKLNNTNELSSHKILPHTRVAANEGVHPNKHGTPLIT